VKIRLWPVLFLGFGTLIILVAFSGLSALRRAQDSYAGISELYSNRERTEQLLNRLRFDVQSSAIAVRDFLLDPDASPAVTRTRFTALQRQTDSDIDGLGKLIAPSDRPRLTRVRRDIEAWWQLRDPVLGWAAGEKAARGGALLKNDASRRREAALGVLADIEMLSEGSLRAARLEIDSREADLPMYVGTSVVPAILAALLVAGFCVFRIFQLEGISSQQRDLMNATEDELRKLSRQLVEVNEEERRSLSRELHDQIGQTLTAVRINLGNLEEALGRNAEPVHYQIDQTKRLSEQALRAVRDLAMGLRPAMLDDLGLGAALEWQARQHSRLCKVPVTTRVEGNLTDLPEGHRTCVYRIVQEALTNAAKHAQASGIKVDVTSAGGTVSISIHDDGVGFDTRRPVNGLGLVGMKERVRQLGGQIAIHSAPGAGTDLRVEIPMAQASA